MKLSESIKKHGYFSLPSISEHKMPGILYISESGKVELDIMGYVSLYTLIDPIISRIVGVLETGEKVTIEDCLWIEKSSNSEGFTRIKICGSIALFGHEYMTDEKIEFNRVTFSINGLSEWLSISGITQELLENTSIAIKFEPPNDIHFLLEDGMKLSFVFELRISCAFEDASLSQRVYVSIYSENPKPLEYFTGVIFKLNNFFCLAIDNTVTISCFSGYLKDITEVFGPDIIETQICIYYETTYAEGNERISTHALLFRYEDVATCFENILKLWLHNYSISEPAFNLYFSSKSGGHKYLESKFLSLAQGIETFHDRNYPNELRIEKREFKDLKKSIIDCCPSDKKIWLEEMIKYGYKLTLRQRIKQLVEPFKELYGSDEQRNELIGKIVTTRNYLTHYDSKLKEKSAQGNELYNISIKLESLFQLHFLKLIGLELGQIENIVAKNNSLRNKINNSIKE